MTERILRWVRDFCLCFLTALAMLYAIVWAIDVNAERVAEMQRPPIERHRAYTYNR